MTPRQMAFDLGAQETYARADFFPSPSNAQAWVTVEDWQNWPLGRMLLIGPAGAGKTHLTHIWATSAGAQIIPAQELAALDPTALPPAIAVEDADQAAGLGNLEILILDNNQLTALPEGIFANMVQLQNLYLQFNDLSELQVGAFAGLGSLQKLNLVFNQLTQLQAGVFAGLDSLQELSLSFNQLRGLPAGLFAGLGHLQRLDLYSNKLSTLPEGLFEGLGSLQELYLHSNQLTITKEQLRAQNPGLPENCRINLSHQQAAQ